MFIDVNIYLIILPAVLVSVVAIWLGRRKIEKQSDPLQKIISTLQLNVFVVGAFSLLLWFLLPISAVLTTFGYPKTPSDIQNPELLLDYLQAYNHAIARTADVMYWFIFIFVWWLLATVFSLAKALSLEVGRKKEESSALSPDQA